MRFKVDQNLPVEVAEALRTAGRDADTVDDESLAGASDRKLAEYASTERRAIVSLDVGFADIRAYPPSEHPGLMVLRPAHQEKGNVLRLIARVIPLLEREPLAGRLWIVDERRVRIRN